WVLAALLAGAARGAPAPARVVSESEVHEVAGGLRCVVCQNLSVADSPSEMARQMRAIVRERLEAGESPGEVVQYFVDRYGEWILLSPRRSGFNLLVWAAPLVAVAVGLAIVSVLVRPRSRPAPSCSSFSGSRSALASFATPSPTGPPPRRGSGPRRSRRRFPRLAAVVPPGPGEPSRPRCSRACSGPRARVSSRDGTARRSPRIR